MLSPFNGKSQVFLDDLRCLPVQIQIPMTNNFTDFGTGMFIRRSNFVYFVTAAHCLFDNTGKLINANATLTSSIRGTNKSEKAYGSLDLAWSQAMGFIKRHPTHDVAVVKVAVTKETTNSTLYTISASNGFVTDQTRPVMTPFGDDGCTLFEEVPIGGNSYVLGYPISLFNGQQSEIDFQFPLVRKGLISQKNYRTKKFIIDSGVYGGNSGGPVLWCENDFNKTYYHIIGIITQYVPAFTTVNATNIITVGSTNVLNGSVVVNSGYSVAEPIDFAFELMDEFK